MQLAAARDRGCRDVNSCPAPSTGELKDTASARPTTGPSCGRQVPGPRLKASPGPLQPFPCPYVYLLLHPLQGNVEAAVEQKLCCMKVFPIMNRPAVATFASCCFLHWNTDVANKKSSIYPSVGKATVPLPMCEYSHSTPEMWKPMKGNSLQSCQRALDQSHSFPTEV